MDGNSQTNNSELSPFIPDSLFLFLTEGNLQEMGNIRYIIQLLGCGLVYWKNTCWSRIDPGSSFYKISVSPEEMCQRGALLLAVGSVSTKCQ